MSRWDLLIKSADLHKGEREREWWNKREWNKKERGWWDKRERVRMNGRSVCNMLLVAISIYLYWTNLTDTSKLVLDVMHWSKIYTLSLFKKDSHYFMRHMILILVHNNTNYHREATHLQYIFSTHMHREGRGYARALTWWPLPNLIKIGVYTGCLHCMALLCI